MKFLIIAFIIISIIGTIINMSKTKVENELEKENKTLENLEKNNLNNYYIKNINKNINTIKWILLLPIISNIILIIIFISLINK